jgi:hypothetical protein
LFWRFDFHHCFEYLGAICHLFLLLKNLVPNVTYNLKNKCKNQSLILDLLLMIEVHSEFRARADRFSWTIAISSVTWAMQAPLPPLQFFFFFHFIYKKTFFLFGFQIGKEFCFSVGEVFFLAWLFSSKYCAWSSP